MIIRRLADVHDTPHHVTADTWDSHRLLVAGDDLGFSLHHTVIRAGSVTEMQYLHHLEAVYCIAGSGFVTELATQERHRISPGTLYALDQHDAHVLVATSEMQLVCVFNPPCRGTEQHDANGSYPLDQVAHRQ